MSRRVTIDDVARLAEVHKATVSRALNARTRDQVNAETLKRVKRAARQLGYVPNAMARGLRTSRSMTVGVIIPDLMNPIFPPIVRGIEHVLQPHGYTVLVADTDSHDDVEVSAFESLLQRRVDGSILAYRASRRPDHERRGDRGGSAGCAGLPAFRRRPYPVVSGNWEWNRSAVTHLVTLGHVTRPCCGSAERYSQRVLGRQVFDAGGG